MIEGINEKGKEYEGAPSYKYSNTEITLPPILYKLSVQHAAYLSEGDNHVKFLQKAEEHGLDPHLHALLALESELT